MARIVMVYIVMAYTVMACIVMAYTVMACILMAYIEVRTGMNMQLTRGRGKVQQRASFWQSLERTFRLACRHGCAKIAHKNPHDLCPCDYGLYSYGIYSYALYSYGLYSYGLYSYGLCGYGLYSYGPCPTGVCTRVYTGNMIVHYGHADMFAINTSGVPY